MKNLVKSFRALKEEDHRRALYASLVFIMLMILFFLLVSLEESWLGIEVDGGLKIVGKNDLSI